MAALAPASIGWYGKLPSRGDFVGRGLPAPWLRAWDDWLQRSLALGAQRLGAAALRERLLAMPPWQFVVPAAGGDGPAWCGVVATSTDRVGRVFPLLVAEGREPQALAGTAVGALQRRTRGLGRWVQRSRALSSLQAFEDAVAELGAGAGIDDGPPIDGDDAETVDELQRRCPAAGSFWWCDDRSDRAMPRAEAWPPRESLLLDWIGEPA
jgi:type VI secretion system protein ImpM